MIHGVLNHLLRVETSDGTVLVIRGYVQAASAEIRILRLCPGCHQAGVMQGWARCSTHPQMEVAL